VSVSAPSEAAIREPTVSVILPTYQRRELVRRAVASVMAQTYRDFELIVVDDGSTDDTGATLAPLGDRIRYRWQPNRGVAAARNAGLRMARGSIVAFLDSDDLWLPDHLAVVTEMLERQPGTVLASTCPAFKLSGDQTVSDARVLDYRQGMLFSAGSIGWPSCIAVRPKALLAIGGFDERLRAMSDSDMWRRLATLGPFSMLNRRTVICQETRGSLSELARRRGDYLAAAELGAANLISAVGSLPEPERSRLSPEANGLGHLARAFRALDHGDEAAVRMELAEACRLLPLSEYPALVTSRLRMHLPLADQRRHRFRALVTLVDCWPLGGGLTPRYLRASAVGRALASLRLREAARLAAGWRLRGTLRFAREIQPFLSQQARRWAQDRRHRARRPPDPLPRRLANLGHRVMLRTEGGPLRALWWFCYESLARLVASYLLAGERGGAAYVKGSMGTGEQVYGISDIDLVMVVPEGADAGVARERVHHRWRRLRRRLPILSALLFQRPRVYEEPELAAAVSATTLTHELDQGDSEGKVSGTSRERARQGAGAERLGLYGTTWDWRLIRGKELRGPPGRLDQGERRIRAWLELQFWWLQTFKTCLSPDAPWAPLVCVKLIAEPARIWMWLAHGKRFSSRGDLLDAALRCFPEEEAAVRIAIELLGSLRTRPPAPLDETLLAFARMSTRIATRLGDEVEGAGTTNVRLLWGGPEELVTGQPPAGSPSNAVGARAPDLLPLADWRARVWSLPPDECFELIEGEPTEPRQLATATVAGEQGVYPALGADRLLIFPSLRRARLRAVQCEATDPVSFALVEGRTVAAFPNLPGWSAGDSARRAVAEHLGWLRTEAESAEPATEALGRLFTASRAALFLDSLQAGDPELALTASAVVDSLQARFDNGGMPAQEALAAYRRGRTEGIPPPADLFAAMREGVMELPAFTESRRNIGVPS
jgi:glycosyl transferase family 2